MRRHGLRHPPRPYPAVIDFLLYSRAAGGEPDQRLTEEHWAYMDPYAEQMTARGPTLAPDRDTWTGSLHIVDLADDEAANRFLEHEPYNRAGLFESHVVRRFRNLLGRTMWQFPRESSDPRFLILAGLRSGDPRNATGPTAPLPQERLIIHGELSAPGSGDPDGVLLAVEAPDREAVEELLARPSGPYEGVDLEIHDWEFGGRR